MITILIGVCAGIWLSIVVTKNDYLKCFDLYMLNGFLGMIGGGIIGLVIAILLPMQTYVNTRTLVIESLQDNSSVNGAFFLGSGQIEGRMKYVFYYRDGDVFRMEQIDYDKAAIRYTDGQPKAVIKEILPISVRKEPFNYFAIDLDLLRPISYTIEVPKGSIKNNYTLDAN